MSDILMIDLVGILFKLLDFMEEYTTIILAVNLLFSLVQCFFGYRIFKFWIAVQGFVLFGIIGIVIGYLSFEQEIETCFIFGLLLGVLGALIAMELYKIGVFLQCFWTGSIIAVLLGIIGELEMGQIMSLAILSGIGIGIIGVKLIKLLVILSTGFAGGITSGCIVALTSGQDLLIGVFGGIIVSILGILYQFYSSGEDPAKVTLTQDDNVPIQNSDL